MEEHNGHSARSSKRKRRGRRRRRRKTSRGVGRMSEFPHLSTYMSARKKAITRENTHEAHFRTRASAYVRTHA